MTENSIFYATCLGSIIIGTLRHITGLPFPTALCLLISVGMIGYIQEKSDKMLGLNLMWKVVIFEISLVIASILSYGDKVYWYFIAYNIGFVIYYLFQRNNVSILPLSKLGELGFTFFLGADIPIYFIMFLYPDFIISNCYVHAIIKFVLAIIFSYMITRWCEKPLLALGKRLENNFSK